MSVNVKDMLANKKIATMSEEDQAKLGEGILDFIGAGGTLKMLKSIDEKSIDSAYAVGYNFYQSGQYEEAVKIFRILCLLDHYQEKYFTALGASKKMLGDYKEAMKALSFSALLNPEDPNVFFYVGECGFALEDFNSSFLAFQKCFELIPEDTSSMQQKKLKESARAKTMSLASQVNFTEEEIKDLSAQIDMSLVKG